MSQNLYQQYQQHLQKVADVAYAGAVLNWDQETYMPEGSSEIRGRQLSTLSGLAHSLFTSKEFGELLEKLSNESALTPLQKNNVKLTLEDYKKQTGLNTEFVEQLSKTISQSFNAWQKAKQDNNFKIFEPHLQELAKLKKEEALMMGYKNPYEGMLDVHEKGVTMDSLNQLFDDVRKELVPFVKQISEAKQVNDQFLYREYDQSKQWEYSIGLLKNIGFDFHTGRQDKSSHPFTTSFGSRDVRVTTRIRSNDLAEVIWSTIHEGGHALYEQGLPFEEYGLPSGEAAGLGMHESQSRLWENNVGRGLDFWTYHYPQLQQIFKTELSDVSLQDFYFAMNKVEPSLIRTNSDELTYHFHIMIRYEVEKALMFDEIKVSDLPAFWNEKYKSYLSLNVPDDASGILQDVHWSHGSFGYFPTYSIGSFYAAQFFQVAEKQIQGLGEKIRNGNCNPLVQWLREHIHQYGKQYTSDELCEKLTGEKLNFSYFMNYAREKYAHIYQLK